jgi:hypothetical protein
VGRVRARAGPDPTRARRSAERGGRELSTRSTSMWLFPEQDQPTLVSTSSVWTTSQACGATWSTDVRLGRAVPDTPHPNAIARWLGVAGSPSGPRAPPPRSGLRWQNYRTLWLRGQPSPTRGHGGSDEPVPAGCPRDHPVVTTPLPDGDHRTVTLRAERDVLVHGSGRQDEHLAGRPPDRCSPTQPPRDRSRAERGPPPPSTGGHVGWRAEAAGGASPTDLRESRSRIAPTPPTRGRDPICRLSMAVLTTMSARYFGSCPERSRVSVVHRCRHDHGQPLLRIMAQPPASAERLRPRHPAAVPPSSRPDFVHSP